jgi:hypothetical protein
LDPRRREARLLVGLALLLSSSVARLIVVAWIALAAVL